MILCTHLASHPESAHHHIIASEHFYLVLKDIIHHFLSLDSVEEVDLSYTSPEALVLVYVGSVWVAIWNISKN